MCAKIISEREEKKGLSMVERQSKVEGKSREEGISKERKKGERLVQIEEKIENMLKAEG